VAPYTVIVKHGRRASIPGTSRSIIVSSRLGGTVAKDRAHAVGDVVADRVGDDAQWCPRCECDLELPLRQGARRGMGSVADLALDQPRVDGEPCRGIVVAALTLQAAALDAGWHHVGRGGVC